MVKVFVCATKNTIGLQNFKRSFQSFDGWEVEILQYGKPWEGFVTRMRAYRECLANLEKTEIVVILDGYDVLCCRDSHGFIEKFKTFETPIVFGSETFCLHFINCRIPKKYQSEHQQKGVYVNGGCMVGYVKDLYFLWDWVIKNNLIQDDQIAVSHFMDSFPEKIKLDVENTLFFNDNFGETATYELNNHKIIVNGKYEPYFIHFPGMMIKQQILFHLRNKYPKNYIQIGQHLCGNDFLENHPISPFLNIIYMIMLLLILLLLILIVYLIAKKKNVKK